MKVGIVGCGHIAHTHARILAELHGSDALAFCDRNPEKAASFAARYSPGPSYSSAGELLAHNDLGAVHVTTQLGGHAEVAEEALRAGVNVYVEKPVTDSAATYKALADLADAHKAVLHPGFSLLGMPVLRQAREVVDSASYGRLITVHCDFNSSNSTGIPYGDPGHWAYSLPGGILQNIADHPASVVVSMMDGVDSHRAMVVRRNPLPNDCADLLHVAVANHHQVGSFTTSFGHGSAHAQATLCMEAATLQVDLRRQLLTMSKGRGPEGHSRRIRSGLAMGWSAGSGTVVNLAKYVSGSLRRDPGLVGSFQNFYATIAGTERLIADRQTTETVVSLLEQVWRETAPENGS